MNIPNSLTILRILLIPVYVGLLIYERFNGAMIVLLVAGVTDALDGTIARAANQRTRLGAFLDPLADKLPLTSGFVTLSAIHLIPSWVTILVVSRDAMLLLGTAAQFTESNIDIAPTFSERGHLLATRLRAACDFLELASLGSIGAEPALDRHGRIYGLLRLSLSLSWVPICWCISNLIAYRARFAATSRRLCICLTVFQVTSRLAT